LKITSPNSSAPGLMLLVPMRWSEMLPISEIIQTVSMYARVPLGQPDSSPDQLRPTLMFGKPGFLNCRICEAVWCSGCDLLDTDRIPDGFTLDSTSFLTSDMFYLSVPPLQFPLLKQMFHSSQNDPFFPTKADAVTLMDCFEAFTTREVLSKDDAWFCPQCRTHRSASKALSIWKVPNILIIQLKRFGNRSATSISSSFREKISTLVEFPLEGLSLDNFVGSSGDHDELVYDLFAVSNHYGSLFGGHYTAYICRQGQWYECDDSRVSKVFNPDQVITSAAYVLFYKRRTKPASRSPQTQELE
jgi:hypothetical protein